MQDSAELRAIIRRTTRRRFLFSVVTLILYSSFVLCYTDAENFLQRIIGDSGISWGLVLFIFLIPTFLTLEYIFLRLYQKEN